MELPPHKAFKPAGDHPVPKYRSVGSAAAPAGVVWRINPRHAIAAAALCWLLFAATCLLLLSGHAEALDQMGLLLWRQGPLLLPRGPIWLLEAVRDLTALGGVLLRNLFAVAAASLLIVLRRRREAWLLAATVVSGWLVEALLKLAVGRDRPMIVPHLTEAGGAGFPSGHSFNAALVYIALALAFAALTPRPRLRWTLILCAALLSLAIAFSRVWLGVHFPSDALAGWSGGAAWAFTAAALLDRPAAKAAAFVRQEPGV